MSLEPLPTHWPGSTTSCCCELTAVSGSQRGQVSWGGTALLQSTCVSVCVRL